MVYQLRIIFKRTRSWASVGAWLWGLCTSLFEFNLPTQCAGRVCENRIETGVRCVSQRLSRSPLLGVYGCMTSPSESASLTLLFPLFFSSVVFARSEAVLRKTRPGWFLDPIQKFTY